MHTSLSRRIASFFAACATTFALMAGVCSMAVNADTPDTMAKAAAVQKAG